MASGVQAFSGTFRVVSVKKGMQATKGVAVSLPSAYAY